MTSGEQQAVSSSSGRGMPGIAVTDAATINTQLGVEALPNGFVSLPVYTFVESLLRMMLDLAAAMFVMSQ